MIAAAVPLFRVRGLLFSAALLLASGCASQLGSATKLPPLTSPVKSQLGKTIGVSTPRAPAAFSFEPSSGQAGSAIEGAMSGMRKMALAAVGAEEAAIAAVALLPVAALVGAVIESSKTLSPDAVKKTEVELNAGLLAAADQSEFREQFFRIARERAHPRFARLGTGANAGHDAGGEARSNFGADWILELSVADLRLQRTSLTDASYALFITTRVRLLRAADAAVVYDAPIQFQSGEALFVDWTFDRGAPLRRVAEFGYRTIAGEILAQLFAEPAS